MLGDGDVVGFHVEEGGDEGVLEGVVVLVGDGEGEQEIGEDKVLVVEVEGLDGVHGDLADFVVEVEH